MPELPEVESVVRTLRETILDQEIREFSVSELGLNSLGNAKPEDFSRLLVGNKFAAVDRIGKYIILRLADGKEVIAHLRMTGRFLYTEAGKSITSPPVLLNDNPDATLDPYIRFSIELERGNLGFSDKRRFGTFHMGPSTDYKGLLKLGPDAMTPEFTPEYLVDKLAGKKKPIYSSLLDQEIVAGLGNIYVCEVLAKTGVHPLTPSNTLDPTQLRDLHKHVVETLQEAILSEGTSFSDYRNALGKQGGYQHKLLVYGKSSTQLNGKEFDVKKVKIGGRTAYFIAE